MSQACLLASGFKASRTLQAWTTPGHLHVLRWHPVQSSMWFIRSAINAVQPAHHRPLILRRTERSRGYLTTAENLTRKRFVECYPAQERKAETDAQNAHGSG